MSLLSSLSSAISSLTNAGLSTSEAATLVGSIFGGVSSTIKPYLAVIVANPTNATLVQDNVNKILETANLPASVVPMVNSLPAAAASAGTPAGLSSLIALVNEIEQLA